MYALYGDRHGFLTKFNPDLQMKVCKDAELCFFGDAPFLSELNMAYGEMTATMWLVPQLYDLSEYCGCRDKLQGKPLEECASVIAAEFFYLKVSEIMLFFHWFKAGRFGRFYGSVDPLVITTSLREFVKLRNVEIDKREQEDRRKANEESAKNAITYEEYQKIKGEIAGMSGLNPLTKVSDVLKKTEKTSKKYDAAHILQIATGLVENTYNADEKTLNMMKKFFEKDYGCSPEKWLKSKS